MSKSWIIDEKPGGIRWIHHHIYGKIMTNNSGMMSDYNSPYRYQSTHYCCVCCNSIVGERNVDMYTMNHPSGVGNVNVCNNCLLSFARQDIEHNVIRLEFSDPNAIVIKRKQSWYVPILRFCISVLNELSWRFRV